MSVSRLGAVSENDLGLPPMRRSRILVVDDQEASRRSLQRLLESLGHDVELAGDGVEALVKLRLDVDLVLLDATMPDMDGFEVAEHIRSDRDHADLPIVMVTGLDRREDRLRAASAGVNDYVTKPVDITELSLRMSSLLKLKEASDGLKRQGAELEATVQRRTAALREALEDTVQARRSTYQAHLDTIRILVLAAEYKDRTTGSHIERIGGYSEHLGGRLGLAPRQVELLRHAAPLHDVGKIGIPDSILLKPGRLTPEERRIMETHTTIGAGILAGSRSDVIQLGQRIALSHHERYDGAGYPNGLRGDEIPFEGRICAVADFFDALASDRPYRQAVPCAQVFEMMREERGRHFDPHVLDVFLADADRIVEIRTSLCNGGTAPSEVRTASAEGEHL